MGVDCTVDWGRGGGGGIFGRDGGPGVDLIGGDCGGRDGAGGGSVRVGGGGSTRVGGAGGRLSGGGTR